MRIGFTGALDLLCYNCAQIIICLENLVKKTVEADRPYEAVRVQGHFLRSITAMRKSILCAATSLSTLTLHIKFEAMKTTYRLYCVGTWNTNFKRDMLQVGNVLRELWRLPQDEIPLAIKNVI